MTTINKKVKPTAGDFDPNNYKPGRIIQALTELLKERKEISLDDLYRIGLIMLRLKKKDMTLTALFINKWDMLSMCGQDEDMIQCVADLADELIRQLLMVNNEGQKQNGYVWLRLPQLVSDVFNYRQPAVTAA